MGLPASTSTPTLTTADGRLHRDGVPWQLLAGSIHYFRVHPAQWRDRLRRLVDIGMNTVDTYVAWNFHQPHEHSPADFTGWRDVEGFLRAAQEEGLSAVVRPGPYICAEWRNGGLPTWLTGRGIPLRCTDPRYLDPVRRWFDDLIPRLAALQAVAGGPVVAVQVENEFGSHGDDPDLIAAMRDMLTERGIRELLYTADGPTESMTDAGATPGTLMALNFGSRADQARALHAALRPGEPFVCGEFWNGWFDHWDGPHNVRSAESAASTLRDIVADGGGVSVYMAHGGTNFGTWAGANDVDGALRATVTSYDSDAAIAEDGTLTPKFFALREVLGRTEPVRSTPPVFVTPQTVPLRLGGSLLAAPTGDAVRVTVPCATDALGLDSDLVRFDADVRLPHERVTLSLSDARDRAHVYVDGRFLGTVDGAGSFDVDGDGPAHVTVFCEVVGRINYGPRLGEHKGLLGPVLVGRRMVQWWACAPVTLGGAEVDAAAANDSTDDPTTGERAHGGPGAEPAAAHAAPAFATGSFGLTARADAHLALPGWGRGFVWVNGFLLGRYRACGPQHTLYVPAPLLRGGENTLTLLEFEHPGTAARLEDTADLGLPEEFIEEF